MHDVHKILLLAKVIGFTFVFLELNHLVWLQRGRARAGAENAAGNCAKSPARAESVAFCDPIGWISAQVGSAITLLPTLAFEDFTHEKLRDGKFTRISTDY
jgi:hypothetical protein